MPGLSLPASVHMHKPSRQRQLNICSPAQAASSHHLLIPCPTPDYSNHWRFNNLESLFHKHKLHIFSRVPQSQTFWISSWTYCSHSWPLLKELCLGGWTISPVVCLSTSKTNLTSSLTSWKTVESLVVFLASPTFGCRVELFNHILSMNTWL